MDVIEPEDFTKQIYHRLVKFSRQPTRPECLTCECYFTLLVHLQQALQPLDEPQQRKWEQKVSDMLENETAGAMHCCLGCDPCPPADWTSDMIRASSKRR